MTLSYIVSGGVWELCCIREPTEVSIPKASLVTNSLLQKMIFAEELARIRATADMALYTMRASVVRLAPGASVAMDTPAAMARTLLSS